MKKAEDFPPGPSIVPRRLIVVLFDANANSEQVIFCVWIGHAQALKSEVLPEVLSMPKSHPAQPAAELPATYEAAMQELEQLVSQLESGLLPLDQLLAGYQRGAALLALCKDKLQAVEDQIKILDGNQMKPWGDA